MARSQEEGNNGTSSNTALRDRATAYEGAVGLAFAILNDSVAWGACLHWPAECGATDHALPMASQAALW